MDSLFFAEFTSVLFVKSQFQSSFFFTFQNPAKFVKTRTSYIREEFLKFFDFMSKVLKTIAKKSMAWRKVIAAIDSVNFSSLKVSIIFLITTFRNDCEILKKKKKKM